MADREPPNIPADSNVSPYLLRPTRSLRQVLEQRERQRETLASQLSGKGAPPDPPGFAPSELAALTDLGLSDGAISAYLLLDPERVAQLRNPSPVRPGDPGTGASVQELLEIRALDRLTVAELRHHARVLIAESRRAANPYERAGLAEHAFELAQLAESAERHSVEVTTSLSDTGESVLAALQKAAARSRAQAASYGTAAEKMHDSMTSEAYRRLARSYEASAADLEAQVGLYEQKLTNR